MYDMTDLIQLTQIDWWQWFLATCLIVFCVRTLWIALDWLLFEKLKIETGKMKQQREDHEKLKITYELAQKTAENLDKLQARHTKDEEEFRNNLNNYMEESRKDRQALHDEMTIYSTNRINDRKQSMQIQKDLNDTQNKITDKVDEISKKLDEMKKRENKRVQSEIKERIAQYYREYKKTKKITAEELEALEDLIETYENHGGENSFVHSLVQKEMYTWEVE